MGIAFSETLFNSFIFYVRVGCMSVLAGVAGLEVWFACGDGRFQFTFLL